jgi:DnaK suppressor protein
MTPARLEYFRKLFTQSIEGLLGEAGKTVSEMTGGAESFPDVTDRASQESDRNFELRIRDRERKLVKKIKEALQRIDDGTFGTCEVCGKKISEKRLTARPVTTLCIACKTKQEEQEKQRGE